MQQKKRKEFTAKRLEIETLCVLCLQVPPTTSVQTGEGRQVAELRHCEIVGAKVRACSVSISVSILSSLFKFLHKADWQAL